MDYQLQDVMLFSAQVYWRLIEGYQAHFVAVAALFNLAFLSLLGFLRRTHAVRTLGVLMTACWIWLGWRFYIIEYASINWFASYLGAACLLQSMLFIWFSGRPGPVPRIEPVLVIGTSLYVLVMRPLIVFALRGEWQITPLSLNPMPTLLLSVGLIFALQINYRWLYLCLPVLLMLIESATLYLLSDPLWQEGPVLFVLLAMLILKGFPTKTRASRLIN